MKNPHNFQVDLLHHPILVIVTAPVFLAASIYTILSALINRLDRENSPIFSRAILLFFIASATISTHCQSGAHRR
jgi:hypothetical protein